MPSDAVPMLPVLAQTLGVALAPDGWIQRPAGPEVSVLFTNAVAGDLVACLRVKHFFYQRPGPWPLWVELGASLETVLGLGPKLTLPSTPILLLSPESGGPGESRYELADASDVPRLTEDIARAATALTLWVADLGDPATFFNAVLAAAGRSNRNRRSLFFAAGVTGHFDIARATLEEIASEGTLDRFVRQASRWLDAGAPSAPALAQEVGPAPSRPARPSLGGMLIQSLRSIDAKRDALTRLRKYRRRHPEAGVMELRGVLAADYLAHGVTSRPVVTANVVDRLVNLGGLKSPLLLARTTLIGVQRITVLIRERRLPHRAEQFTAPVRAAYRPSTIKATYIEVTLDASGVQWLRANLPDTEIYVGSAAHFPVWLERRDGESTVFVGTGEQRLGHLPAENATMFDPALRAAADLDELVRLTGFYLDIEPPVLDIPVPDGTGEGTAFV